MNFFYRYSSGSSDSDKSTGSSSGSEEYDSDMELDGLDLTKDLRPLTHYPTRREITDNMFNIIRGDIFRKMVPEKFKNLERRRFFDGSGLLYQT